MYKFSLKSLLVAPVLLGAAVLTSLPATAQVRSNGVETVPSASGANDSVLNQVKQYSNEGRARRDGMSQLTSISQLSDVQPSDWAFQALQSLVERYGCIAGYPDGTYRGSRPLTRYEFAAGLNACMDRVNELIAAATADLVTKEDLETLRRLQEEFAAELATLRGRVDALEARTAKLEAQQFSTTTKLRGEAIFTLIDAFGDASEGTTGDVDRYNTTFGNRVRLNFDTSFTGTDRLRVRLQSGNILDVDRVGTDPANQRVAPGREGRLGYSFNNGNAVEVQQFEYRFQIGRPLRVLIAANGRELNALVDTVSPFEASESGALSRFGRFNPIFRTGNNKGIAFNWNVSSFLRVDAAYLAGEANLPSLGDGLFSGDYAALGQVVLTPFQGLKLGLTYINGYNDSGLQHGTGSLTSNIRTGKASFISYGVQASFQLSRT
ncbi:MAG: iron uptake porin, partial [Leptolyngbyaceae cyanobacterium bins.59]|nr:iron uptake porin [Leptolyngbyaceae cyanobacterium bins.59]